MDDDNIRLAYAKALNEAINAFNDYMDKEAWDIETRLEFKASQLLEEKEIFIEVIIKEG